MNVFVNEMTGIADAMVSMYMSKRSWSRDLEVTIRKTCRAVLTEQGALKKPASIASEGLQEEAAQFADWMDKLVKWGWKHTTLLRFIDISATVEGIHRAGQDDWDAHAKRFNNRILRSSTRLASFGYETSAWYADKILPTDVALSRLGADVPPVIELDGVRYVKAVNGYIREDMADNQDVKRGLYMLSIPSNFIFKVDLTEWSHVYKMRNNGSGANPEVKECCERIADQITEFHAQFDRALFKKIKN